MNTDGEHARVPAKPSGEMRGVPEIGLELEHDLLNRNSIFEQHSFGCKQPALCMVGLESHPSVTLKKLNCPPRAHSQIRLHEEASVVRWRPV